VKLKGGGVVVIKVLAMKIEILAWERKERLMTKTIVGWTEVEVEIDRDRDKDR
jgi:hypothetical protein